MHVIVWLASPSYMKIDNKGYDSDIEDEHIVMHLDLEAKAMFKSKHLTEY